MRDMVTCFSEHAVRISETTCSSYINQDHQPCILSNLNVTPSIPNAVVSLYKTTTLFSDQKQQFLITVTWCRNQLGQGGLNINFGNDPSTFFKLNTFSRLFRKKKGQKSFEVDCLKVDVYWDLSSASYHTGPEPVDGYYLVVVVESEPVLALGDLAQEAVTKRLKSDFSSLSKSILVSRREHYSGNAFYCTKAQFCDSGVIHEIMIRCSEDNEKAKQPVLYVSIDKKTVIKVRRLQWNFRGNQTVFVDGLLVDLMWDVHDWFFNPVSGSAVFMFKTRTGGESRLWLEEKLAQKDQERVDFSLLIFASKSP